MVRYSYLTMWVYDGHIDDGMIVYRMIKEDNGYFNLLLEWHVIWVMVKYVVSCVGWLVSLTWCLYEYEYVMSWFRMLNPLSVECMNDIWP